MVDEFEQTVAKMRALNDSIRKGYLYYDRNNSSAGLIMNIRHFGLNPDRTIILHWMPDGDGTVTGRLMDEGGTTYSFDFNLEDVAYSLIESEQPPKVSQRSRMLRYPDFTDAAGRALIAERIAIGLGPNSREE